MPGIPSKPETSPSHLCLPLVLPLVDLFDCLSALLYSPTSVVRRRYVCVCLWCLWRQRDPWLIYKDKNPLKWQPALGWALPSLPGACSPKMFIPDKQSTQPPSSPSPQRNAKHSAFSKCPSPPPDPVTPKCWQLPSTLTSTWRQRRINRSPANKMNTCLPLSTDEGVFPIKDARHSAFSEFLRMNV